MTCAERSKLLLQLHNFPFLSNKDSKKYSQHVSHAAVANFNELFQRDYPAEYEESLEMCRHHCHDDPFPMCVKFDLFHLFLLT